MGAEVRFIGASTCQPVPLMKFTLVYDGDLPSTGNSRKPAEAARIRNELHDQLAELWESHVVLRQLIRHARVPKTGKKNLSGGGQIDMIPDVDGPIRPVHSHMIDLCAAIPVQGSAPCLPLVRASLHLVCAIDILFLRHGENPGALIRQDGDLDGRIKCLFDALRMPSPQEAAASGITPTADPLYCLLEQDSLISDFSVKTGRLLGRRNAKPHAVRLSMDVTVKVLRVTEQNMCLLSD